jgi:phosphoglycolate phosphatase-like HAD superfamily hydrolase
VTPSTFPEHWSWNHGPLEGGRAVVVDIDGVLSDAATRQHYIEAPGRDWRAFFDACGEDPVIDEVRVLLDLLAPEMRVILLTARPQRVHEVTEAWLRRYKIRWDLLITRPWGDYELSRDYKQSTLSELRQFGFELLLGIEDDQRNVDMLRSEGVPCIYFHSGYYE